MPTDLFSKHSSWTVKKVGVFPRLKDPVLVEGLPGIGNVGKLAVDFIVDELKAKKIFEFNSFSLPNSVFVNESNLVELPSIELYHKRFNGKDLLFLAGDVQPSEEVSCYEFSSKVIDVLVKLGGKRIITLGGVGLHNVPKSPKVFCTGNSQKAVDEYKGLGLDFSVYGMIGPIVGATGLLLGLGSQKGILGVAFLAETFGHPMYLGVKGAKQILKVLNKKFGLELDFNKIDVDIKELEEELVKSQNLENVSSMKKRKGLVKRHEANYIG